MASKAGGKGGLAKNPKKAKREPDPDDKDDDNFLEDLVTSTETDKGQPSYSTLEPGGFVTKGADRKMRLDKRHAKIAAATGKPDKGEIEETEQEKLEREAGELMSQLKKAERAEAQAQEKDWMVPKYRSNSVYTSSYKRHHTVQYEDSQDSQDSQDSWDS